MNHETTIKKIKELVPSIMELEFGCQGENKLTKQKFFIVKNCNPMGNEDADITMFSNDSLYLYEGYSKDKDITILGKPITLVVVLRAIDESRNVYTGFELINQKLTLLVDWKLEKDNFNDQSEETKTYIGDLLSNQATD